VQLPMLPDQFPVAFAQFPSFLNGNFEPEQILICTSLNMLWIIVNCDA
jgi:hypothetical protein